VAALGLEPAQLAPARNLEPFCRCFVRLHFGHFAPLPDISFAHLSDSQAGSDLALVASATALLAALAVAFPPLRLAQGNPSLLAVR